MRKFQVDIFDYSGHLVCPIYTNGADISGQAVDVKISYERNGWKELSFKLPTTCSTENGQEENFRLQYIVAEYRIRVIDDYETDWYIITEDNTEHNAFSKNVTVTASHISKLLKNRALDLEFSDSEGNNVGTAEEFLKTILEAAGWNPENPDSKTWRPGKVAKFYEDNGVDEKIRSMNANVKTGAFKLIEDMCTLFEAKPVYNGDKTIDILPMNPFSTLEPGEIPEAVLPGAEDDERYLYQPKVIELHYDKAVKNLTRKINTDNIATRLYGYGSYGDAVSKYCSVQVGEHDEYTFYVGSYPNKTEFCIRDKDGVTRYFTAQGLNSCTLIWSMLDITSRSYVWCPEMEQAFEVYKEPKTSEYITLTGTSEAQTNYFPYLSDYSYYRKIGLLDDETFQKVTKFQRDMPAYYQTIIDRQNELSEIQEVLSYTGVPTDFLRLDVASCSNRVLIVNKDRYDNGVIYRSDYLEKEKNYFPWYVTNALQANGDPVSGSASVILVFHDTDPITWSRSYIQDIDGRTHTEDEKTVHDSYYYDLSEGEEPTRLTLWSDVKYQPGDSVYLLKVDGFSGHLGSLFSDDESSERTLLDQSSVDEKTQPHPTYFVDMNEDAPEIKFNSYGWYYRYNSRTYEEEGELYFSWVERNDTGWKKMYIQDTEPEGENGSYFLNTRKAVLFHRENNEWVKLDSVTEQQVAKETGVVFMECKKRDVYYKGRYSEYTYESNEELPIGNYAMYESFGSYRLFSTDEKTKNIYYDALNGTVYQTSKKYDHIVSTLSALQNTLIWPDENEFDNALFFEGSVYYNEKGKNGTDKISESMLRSNYIYVWPNETYEYHLPAGSVAVLYDANRNYLSYVPSLSGQSTFSTKVDVQYSEIVNPDGYAQFKEARYVRIVMPKNNIATDEATDYVRANYYMRLKDYKKSFFKSNKKNTILSPIDHPNEEPNGIIPLMKKMKVNVDRMYEEVLPAMQAAQKVVSDADKEQAEILGDILREGWWQDSSYVEGDEQRLYDDTLDNLKKIAQPEIDYTFDYLDLYESNKNMKFAAEEYGDIEWPDVTIFDAPHLVDPELDINQWAYMDRVIKCYDKPWETSIEINTKLTLMGQHEFKDVMTRIAEVANETKAKQTVYGRAEAISVDGTISADSIDGEIDVQSVKLSGGVSNWSTDENGNILLESSDGLSALQFSGKGISRANSKDKDGNWSWKPISTGYGIDASSVTSGTMHGDRIEAQTITADKLMANVGNELDIGSNKALNLYSTIDGQKPSGSLKTTDALIEIKAGKTNGVETTPAVINIKSGGQLNLVATAENADIPPSINIDSQGAINMNSGSNINIKSDSGVNIEAGGAFKVASNNFDIDKSGNVTMSGKLTSKEGQIANWYIGDTYLGNANSLADSSVGLRATAGNNDDIVFWAGNRDRANAPFKVQANGAVNISGGADFIIHEEREIADVDEEGNPITKTKNVENIIINNTGIKVGRSGETEEELNENNYNFSVDRNGYAVMRGLRIVDATIEESSIQNSSSMTGGNINSGSLNNTLITNSSFYRGEIHMGETVTQDEQDTFNETFTVGADGTASIKKGSITLGEYTDESNNVKHKLSIDNDGTLTVENARIGSFQTGANGQLYTGIGANGRKTFCIGQKDNPVWIADPDNSKDTTPFILTPGGSVKCGGGEFSGCSLYVMGDEFVNGSFNVDQCISASTNDGGYVSLTKNTTVYANLVANQNLTVNGTFSNPSSKEYKENIKPIQLRDFDRLNPVEFNYKNNSDKHFGLLYEELIDVYPEMCHEENGQKTISYLDMIAVLIKEVQELKSRVAELERGQK